MVRTSQITKEDRTKKMLVFDKNSNKFSTKRTNMHNILTKN